MNKQFDRLIPLIGEDALKKLHNSNVIVFGVGGVGGNLVEALVRSGIGKITIVDGDVVEESNINRQLVATKSTVGKSKVKVLKERLLDINDECEVTAINKLYLPSNKDEFDLSKYDYIVDAIDNVSAKIELISEAEKLNKSMISAMGAGNKLDPTKLEVAYLKDTSVDPLAKILRHELAKRSINYNLKVVYSKEQPVKVDIKDDKRRGTPGSTSFVPPVMGLIMAGEVIKDLIKQ